jgi:hypothetical protein
LTRPSRNANQADGNSAVAIEALRNIRDKAAFSSRGTGKGALLEESYAVFKAVEHGLPLAEVRSGVIDGKLFQKKSIATRRSIWMALRHRYLTADPYVVRSLANATQYGAQSLEYKSLGYLYYTLRDRTVFDLVTGPIWEKWRSGSSSLDPSDFISFVESLSAEHPSVKQWRESTKIRLGRNIFAALRDFGLLVGTQKKSIQQPGVSQETLFHLLSILDAEGLRGGSLLAARDWRLFLLTETQVVGHMVDLARNGWIRFERSGRVVILEMQRSLEIE